MARHELHLKLTLRLYSDDDQRCFGPGIATLLERVVVHRSLRAAAASMGMAYSKAWRIIRTAEGVFGCKLLLSTVGGSHGGGAKLTPEAHGEIVGILVIQVKFISVRKVLQIQKLLASTRRRVMETTVTSRRPSKIDNIRHPLPYISSNVITVSSSAMEARTCSWWIF